MNASPTTIGTASARRWTRTRPRQPPPNLPAQSITPPITTTVPRRQTDCEAIGRYVVATFPLMLEIGHLLADRPPAGWSLADLQRWAPSYADSTTIDRLAEGLHALQVAGFVAPMPARRTATQRRRHPARIRYMFTKNGFWLPVLPITLREHAPQQTGRALAAGRLLWEGVSPRAQVGWEIFMWAVLQGSWFCRVRQAKWKYTRHPVLSGPRLEAAVPRRASYARMRLPLPTTPPSP